MANCNLIKMEDVGMLNILFDCQNFMSCLAIFMATVSLNFFIPILSIHLTEVFKVPKSEIGLYFGVVAASQLLGCYVNQKFFTKIPPYVQFYLSFFLTGIGCLVGGPSKIFDLVDSKTLILIGLFILG